MNAFKKVDVRILYKKDGKTVKSNYCQLVFFRMFQKFMKDPYMIKFVIKTFSVYQCGFFKGISAQHTLLTMIEKMKTSRDIKQCCAATLTDFSKVFDSIPYNLLVVKVNANGFDQAALKTIHSYLIDHKKWVLHLARN